MGKKLYFSALDDTHGRELWKSNGTKAGTVLVKDIQPGEASGSPSNLAAVGKKLFFTADDGVHGQQLWKSNGRSSGTALVKDIWPRDDDSYDSIGYPSLTPVGGKVFFTADDGVHGQELWKSNGRRSDTVLVKDIHRCSGGYDGVSSLTRAGKDLFFVADDGIHGQELWTSDGSRPGTVLVKDINAGGP